MDIGNNEVQNFANQIFDLLKRSAIIIQNNEKKLLDISDLNLLTEDEKKEISKLGSEDYFFKYG